MLRDTYKMVIKDYLANRWIEIDDRLTRLKSIYGEDPKMVAIIVGEDKGSKKYVANKNARCDSFNVKHETIELPEDTHEITLLKLISKLNNDKTVHGIIVQFPLPKHIDANLIVQAIHPFKDLDGLHPSNAGALFQNTPTIVPCTPAGIMNFLKYMGMDPAGKTAVVIGRSNLLGNPIAQLLMRADATVIQCHTKTHSLTKMTSQADIIICAAGVKDLLAGYMVKPGCVVIDAGINVVDNKIYGDAIFEDVETEAAFITPVPGGVGLMTTMELCNNLATCYELLNSM